MKVEPSGVIFNGVCEVQTDKCVARETAPITAVWTFPGRLQVNVCGACIEEQARTGEWKIQGARVLPRVDVAAYSPDKKLKLVVEVKKKPGKKTSLKSWVKTIHHNLIAQGGVPQTPYFLLAVVPDKFYLWKHETLAASNKPPDYEVNVSDLLKKYVEKTSFTFETASEYQFERLISQWLEDTIRAKKSDDEALRWIYESGLYDDIKGGLVMTQAAVAA
ncbi:MAG: hypothetical protein AB1757_19985 [Acidobacteriota bacterium]